MDDLVEMATEAASLTVADPGVEGAPHLPGAGVVHERLPAAPGRRGARRHAGARSRRRVPRGLDDPPGDPRQHAARGDGQGPRRDDPGHEHRRPHRPAGRDARRCARPRCSTACGAWSARCSSPTTSGPSPAASTSSDRTGSVAFRAASAQTRDADPRQIWAGTVSSSGSTSTTRSPRPRSSPPGPTSIQRPPRLASRSNGEPRRPSSGVDHAAVGDGDHLAVGREVVHPAERRRAPARGARRRAPSSAGRRRSASGCSTGSRAKRGVAVGVAGASR